MDNNKRFQELDALRGLAALAVVLFHYTTRYDELYGHAKMNYLDISHGHLGVNLFFIISGFVIFMTITKTKEANIFAKKRIIRLYPAYIASVIITFMTVALFGLPGREVSLIDALWNLTMLQSFIPNIEFVDGAYWSLGVEITFYILVGVVLYFGQKKKIVLLSLIWLIGSGIIESLSILFPHRLTSILASYSITDYTHLFVAGIMFYLVKVSGQKRHYLILALCLIYDYLFMDIYSNFFVTLFFFIFYLLIKEKMVFINIRPLVFLGTISYSFYLVHQNIGYIVINEMEERGLLNEIYLVVPILLTIGIATLLTYYVEKPIVKYFSIRMKDKRIKKEKKINIGRNRTTI
ncbi:peptidoglycan/LPS O-acetylase OafA/YrhL [Planomicrobium koreense]|uniref:Peptidoglycan/LPS O-acetylase OafA/YrhL n=1 Tax=Planococcus koreensis TaxID=112331 RepID=A0A7W8FRU1_9BACL|nr:acyltransferase [Planococcus koreensis]MBB5179378.1 peptidoglycan/LPS O-acetylase OafA/YrhL [Planococcus koreensis]